MQEESPPILARSSCLPFAFWKRMLESQEGPGKSQMALVQVRSLWGLELPMPEVRNPFLMKPLPVSIYVFAM